MVGVLLIAVFLVMAALMFTGRLAAMVALPLLALTLTVVACLPAGFAAAPAGASWPGTLTHALTFTVGQALSVVVATGIPRLAGAILTVMLGGLFGQLLRRCGVADGLVRRVAELSGENTLAVTFLTVLACAFLFTTLGGLGSVIMVATIVFPVLASLGLPPLLASCLFLQAMSLGGIFNLVNWRFYTEVMGLPADQVARFAAPFGVVSLVVLTVFVIVEFRRAGLVVPRRSLSLVAVAALGLAGLVLLVDVPALAQSARPTLLGPVFVGLMAGLVLLRVPGTPERPSWTAMLAPAVPIGLVTLTGLDINAAFVVAVLYLLATSGGIERTRALMQAAVEGIETTAPAVAVMMGLGMVLVAVTLDPVAQALTPLVAAVLPHSTPGYVLFFGVLAPLALYRGPLNVWGMGSGLLKLIQIAGVISPFRVMGAFLAVGQIQGVCDPTNTHNVWVANHQGVELGQILRTTLPYMWALALAGLLLAAHVG